MRFRGVLFSVSMRQDVPAQAIWKRFSFSNFLKTAEEMLSKSAQDAGQELREESMTNSP